MSLIKFNTRGDLFPSIEDFWPCNWMSELRKDALPAVNIHESPDAYEFEVAVPGMDKGDMKVSINDSVLHISGEKKSEKEENKDRKVTRREFSYRSFDRYFELPDNANDDQMNAQYENGILKIRIAKKSETPVNKSKTISIQ